MASFEIPQITFGGLASGLDTNAIIQAMLGVEKVPIASMQKNKASIENKISAYSTLKNNLEALQSAADALKDPKSFNIFNTSVNIESILNNVSANENAIPGAYTVEVTDLATNHQMVSQNYADKNTTTVGTGILSINIGGVDTDIIIEEGQDTLEGIAAAINSSGAEVSASVVDDGSNTPYRLVLTGKDTGEDNAITLDSSGLVGGGQSLTFSNLQTASDAHFKLNNLDMQRGSNEISNALPGLSFTLTGETELNSPVTINVEKDLESIKEKFTEFVSAYNTVAEFVNNHNTYSTATESGGLLMGDSLLSLVQSKLQTTMLINWDENKGDVQLLTHLGINFENNGILELDETELTTALSDNFDDVVTMFSDSGLGDKISDLLEDYTKYSGTIDNKKKSLESIINTMDKQILKAEDRLDTFELNLIKKFSALEQKMSGLQSQQAYLAMML